MIDRIANFFKPNQEKPEIAAIDSSMDSLEKPRQDTPSLPGFLIKFLPQQKSTEQTNNALQAIREALKLPSQTAKDFWNNFTHFFRKNRKNIGAVLATVGASIGFWAANVNPAMAQKSLEVNQHRNQQPNWAYNMDLLLEGILEPDKQKIVNLAGENGGLKELGRNLGIPSDYTIEQQNEIAQKYGQKVLDRRNLANWRKIMGDKNPKIQKIIQERERGQSDAFNKSYNEYSKFEIIYNNPNFLRVLTYQATIDAVIYDIDEILKNKRQALLKELAYQEEIANLIVPEFNIEAIESIPEFSSNRNRDKKDDDQKPPGGGTTAINPETSQQGSNISGPEWTPEERLEFEKLEGLLYEMGENIKTQQRINTNQTVQPANQYYQAVENLDHGNAFEYLKNLVEDEQSGVKKLELNKKVSLLSVQIEQLLSLELTDDDKNGVEALKTMLMKELNERNFSKQEISDFFQPIINRIWKKISRYNINIPAQFQPKNSTEQNPELVNLNHELADLVEDAKISGLSSELVKTYTKLGNIGLTPELLKAQIKNLKLDIITHTLKSIEQNKPFTISIETQKLITNPDLVKTAIERNPEFLVPEFFQNFIAASQKRLKNTQALEFEKQAIIFLLDFIFKTYYAFETVFMNQPVFKSTEAVLNAIQSAEKEVIYTDGKNSFVISSFEIRNRIWLKMKLKNSNGFQFFKFQINEIGKVYPLKNFTFA